MCAIMALHITATYFYNININALIYCYPITLVRLLLQVTNEVRRAERSKRFVNHEIRKIIV